MSLHNNDKRFDLDLAYGQVFEQKVAEILGQSKIEVKTEKDKWKSTGNIVIEYESRGKPSGIVTTDADYWLHNLAMGDDIVLSLLLKVSTLRKYIAHHNPRSVRGGDDMTSKLYLIKLTDVVTLIS
jgi:DNA-directed RNA polymerase specialized sigma subunit